MTNDNIDYTSHLKRILILSATEKESFQIRVFIEKISESQPNPCTEKGIQIQTAAFGIGGASAMFHAYPLIEQADWVILVGIAGSFDQSIGLGEVVQVISDEFADLGVNDRGVFRSVFEVGLSKVDEFPFQNGKIPTTQFNAIPHINHVEGITLNTVSGEEQEIELLKQRYPHATVETMEGAYIHFLAAQFQKKLTHIRGISNYVEPRNRANWKIEEAIAASNETVIAILKGLI